MFSICSSAAVRQSSIDVPALTISSYTIKIQTAPGAGRSFTFNLRHAGTGDYSPANQCVISGTATSCTFNGTITEAALYERDRLDIGASIAGPAIVEQFDATSVIPSGWSGQVDGYRNLILARA